MAPYCHLSQMSNILLPFFIERKERREGGDRRREGGVWRKEIGKTFGNKIKGSHAFRSWLVAGGGWGGSSGKQWLHKWPSIPGHDHLTSLGYQIQFMYSKWNVGPRELAKWHQRSSMGQQMRYHILASSCPQKIGASWLLLPHPKTPSLEFH